MTYIEFQECVLANSTLAEAVRGLPSLQCVQVDQLHLKQNHRAVLEGIDVRKDVKKDQWQQQQPLRVQIVCQADNGDDHYELCECCSRRERDNVADILKKTRQNRYKGKVKVVVDEVF